MSDKDMMSVSINVPKKLFDLIADMAKNANQQLNTNLSAKDLISKWVIQYFGTKNSLDVMAFSAERYKEQFKDEKPEIMELFMQFQEMSLKFDEISNKTNKLFMEIFTKLQNMENQGE